MRMYRLYRCTAVYSSTSASATVLVARSTSAIYYIVYTRILHEYIYSLPAAATVHE